jgi:hypothetical protein
MAGGDDVPAASEGREGVSIKPGDTVLHRPSGELRLVAAVSDDGAELAFCGRPETIAKQEDCEIVRRVSMDYAVHCAHVVERACPDQLRGVWARRWLEKQAAQYVRDVRATTDCGEEGLK